MTTRQINIEYQINKLDTEYQYKRDSLIHEYYNKSNTKQFIEEYKKKHHVITEYDGNREIRWYSNEPYIIKPKN